MMVLDNALAGASMHTACHAHVCCTLPNASMLSACALTPLQPALTSSAVLSWPAHGLSVAGLSVGCERAGCWEPGGACWLLTD